MLFLGCAFFVARCNIIRVSWETKKEQRLSYWKNYIKEFVRGTSLLWLHALFPMSLFLAFFIYPLPLPKWRTCWMAPIKIHNIAMGGILCNEILNERSKIWKSLAIWYYLVGISNNVIYFSFILASVVRDMTPSINFRNSNTLNFYSFLQEVSAKPKTYKLVVDNCDSSIYC